LASRAFIAAAMRSEPPVRGLLTVGARPDGFTSRLDVLGADRNIVGISPLTLDRHTLRK
jgi:hypothetical protein